MRIGRLSLMLQLAFLLTTTLASVATGYAAAITLRGTVHTWNGAPETFAIDPPAGVQGGDVLVAQLAVSTSGSQAINFTATPPGWTKIELDSSADGRQLQSVWYKVATSSAPSFYEWDFGVNIDAFGGIADYYNVNASAPIEVYRGQFNAPSITITAPSVVPVSGGAQLLCLFTSFSGSPDISWGTPGSTTKQWIVENPNATISAMFSDQALTIGGSTNDVTVANSSNQSSVGLLLALQPIPPVVASAPAGGVELKNKAIGAGSGTSLTLNRPVGTAVGDLMIAQVAAINFNSQQITLSPPVGWTSIAASSDAIGDQLHQVWYKVASASDVAASSFSWASSTPVNAGFGISDYFNVDPKNPIGVSGAQFTSNSATVTAPSLITTASSDRLLVMMAAFLGEAPVDWKLPAGTTKEWIVEDASPSVDAAYADALLGNPGTTGAKTATIVAANNSGISIALKQRSDGYWVDSQNGNDNNSGTSSGKPWKTIWKINAQTSLPNGNIVRFKRGGIWQGCSAYGTQNGCLYPPEGLKPTVPGIVFTNYGSTKAALPVIDGADAVTSSWTLTTGNIYQTTVSTGATTYINNVYVDPDSTGRPTGLSAQPALGNDPGWGLMRACGLPGGGATAPGPVVLDPNDPDYASASGSCEIGEMQPGSYVYYPNGVTPDAGSGAAPGVLYVWLAAGDNPQNHTVLMSDRTFGLNVATTKLPGTVLDGFDLRHMARAIYFYGGQTSGGQDNVVVSNNTIHYTGIGQATAGTNINGIQLDGGAAPFVSSNTISYNGGHGDGAYVNCADHAVLVGNSADHDNHFGLAAHVSAGALMQGNTVHDAYAPTAGIYSPSPVLFSGGLYSGDFSSGALCCQTCEGLVLQQNTLYNFTNDAIQTNASGTSIYNNSIENSGWVFMPFSREIKYKIMRSIRSTTTLFWNLAPTRRIITNWAVTVRAVI